MPRISVLGVLLLLCIGGDTSYAGQAATGETVQLVSAHQYGSAKSIVMQSQTAVYVFSCNEGAAGCIVPIPDRPYYLITDSQPIGKMDMDWLKNWYVDYHNATNIGIVPAWTGWDSGDDLMKIYRAVGDYWLVSLTVKTVKK